MGRWVYVAMGLCDDGVVEVLAYGIIPNMGVWDDDSMVPLEYGAMGPWGHVSTGVWGYGTMGP